MQELDAEWHEFWTHLPGHHHDTSAETAAATATIEPATPEDHMSNLLAEAKSILHDGLTRLENVDEAALSAVEAVKVNPTGVSIVNTLASIAHLPDPQGLLATVDATLKAFAAVLAAGVQGADQPQPSFTPAGPVVGGQA